MHVREVFSKDAGPLFALMDAILKQSMRGQLLAAVGIDPNECIYPIAMGVVEVESISTWKVVLGNSKEWPKYHQYRSLYHYE